jgi:RNA polymerase sigma-70 factor (ECF subfamily)
VPAPDPALLGGFPVDEPTLIAAAQSGSTRAFVALVERHQSRVRAYIATHLGSRDAIDDLGQEVFLAAYRSLRDFRTGDSLLPWLLSIARHRILHFLREDARRTRRHADPLDDAIEGWRHARLDADERDLPQRERELEALRLCVEALPARAAALIDQHYYLHRSLTAIAEDEGKKDSAVRMILLRARQALRDCMDGRLGGAHE